MSKAALILIAGGALTAAAIIIIRRRGAAAENVSEDASENQIAAYVENTIEAWTTQNKTETEQQTAMPKDIPQASTNTAAFLEMIKKAEGTAGRGNPYAVCYAYKHTIQNFVDHPAITGEWRGEHLSAAMCAGAGLGAGCVSTAAGAYQIIKSTWVAVKNKLHLKDFSPASQDAGAVELIRQRGALGYVEQGHFADAVYACRKEWASLTGAGYGQGERSLAWLQTRFTDAGGVIA